MDQPSDHISNDQPSRWQMTTFFVKSRILQGKRSWENVTSPVKRHVRHEGEFEGDVIASSITSLWNNDNPLETDLTAGKIENLRIACRRMNNVVVPAGSVFSFWKHLGKTARRKGFVTGREIREGCIIPTIGGGICQMSNALYDNALKAGFTIVERHGHTKVIAGSLAEQNRDATVFWNYVDLRFRAESEFKIQAFMTNKNLVVRFIGKEQAATTDTTIEFKAASHIGNCYSCGKTECPKHVSITPEKVSYGKTAIILDAFSPEHDQYLKDHHSDADLLMVPINGQKANKPNYAWSFPTGAKVKTFPLRAFIRSRKIRGLRPTGRLQEQLFEQDRQMALAMAKCIKYDVSHLVVSQNLLPFLWDHGVLWGRSFDVLMTRHSYKHIQQQLDAALYQNPSSDTLGDFRIDSYWVEAEAAALKAARTLITPHTGIAREYETRGLLTEWHTQRVEPRVKTKAERPVIVFGGPPLARKGVLEFMGAIKGLDVELRAPGKSAETDLIRSTFQPLGSDWTSVAEVLVLPAHVEHAPRLALKALAHKIPVIASATCGLPPQEGLVILPEVSPEHIRSALKNTLSGLTLSKERLAQS